MDLLNIDEDKYTKMIEIEDKKIEELEAEKKETRAGDRRSNAKKGEGKESC